MISGPRESVDVDLAIIGSGSGNSVLSSYFVDRQVALIESRRFGGTCLNVGCIPTKMLSHTAYVAETISGAGDFGLDADLRGVRWRDIRDRVFGRTDPVSDKGHRHRADAENIALYDGRARFTAPRTLRVTPNDGTPDVVIRAEQIVLATGARPIVPDVVAQVPHHTTDTVMRIENLPGEIVILGSGYVAAEFAHIFSALGVRVRVVSTGSRFLSHHDDAISADFTRSAQQRWDVHLEADVTGARQDGERVVLSLSDGSTVEGDLLLVATGRRPNSDGIGLTEAGIEVGDDGRVHTDVHGRTSADGVWALGDVSSSHQLKHVANAEARTVAHNLVAARTGGALVTLPTCPVPSAVFSEPQVATVGATSTELDKAGRTYATSHRMYSSTAYGWALQDETGFCRLYADPDSGMLLGAHILGPHASILIQPLVQAMSLGQSVAHLAREQYWIHPALSEVVENALLGLDL